MLEYLQFSGRRSSTIMSSVSHSWTYLSTHIDCLEHLSVSPKTATPLACEKKPVDNNDSDDIVNACHVMSLIHLLSMFCRVPEGHCAGV